ncbi:MAG TPA: nucleotide exchange factor GrpE [Candidatus Sulfotelmatobacter sp.]|jgi:molecular chaperone GrpE (heat shock protein)|nr:nucleotide exchange factor GrpE [Candidatus Sulfotelmatobacter sp.]
MNEVSEWKITKWPFIAAGIALLAVAAVLATRPAHAITEMEIILATVSVALGAILACLPFILEYRAVKKLIEVNAVTTITEQLHDLKTYSAQISAATDQWARVQDATKGHSEKTVAGAKEIADRMTVEIREFNEFQVKLNDTEKGALRLEVEKLRRAEGEWLQVVARILDHVYALHTAAVRSNQPEVAAQIGSFQNACRDAARRVGFTPFGADAGEKFDAQKHRVHDVENPPADSTVAELLAPGISFQGRLVRPALVRLQDANAPVQEPEKIEEETVSAPAADELPL